MGSRRYLVILQSSSLLLRYDVAVISLHYCDASVDCHLNIDGEVL